MQVTECDILIAGGGTGGTSATLHAARLGRKVVVLEETDWLGGQLTSQGVSALDEHAHIEQFGGTQSYYELRNAIRKHYATTYRLTERAIAGTSFNPGNCWVTHLAFEPRVAVQCIDRMLEPVSSNIERHFHSRVVEVKSTRDRIKEITAATPDGTRTFRATVFLDATETGEFSALAGAEIVQGREGRKETSEPDAYEHPDPGCIQSFTFPFAVELRPGEDHTIPKPRDYEKLKAMQQYSFTDGAIRRLFGEEWQTLWTYRRLLASENFADGAVPNDLCMINTASNDYRGPSIIGKSTHETDAILDEARRASLGFLYWMQTEAPRHDSDRCGYPEIMLRPDVMGTADGCSKTPYIRESRRLRTQFTVREQDIVVRDGSGRIWNASLRAKPFPDSVGIGWYHLDCHRSCTGDPGRFWPTRPFQIPLGVLVPVRVENLIPACKNIGVTHLSNGAYRLHPVEWAIGQAAATLADHAIESGRSVQSHDVASVQQSALRQGAPIYWYIDVPYGLPEFEAVQMLATAERFADEPATDLRFRPNDPLTPQEAAVWRTPDLAGMPRGRAAERVYHAE